MEYEEMKRQLRTHVGCKIIDALRTNPDVLNRMLRRIETNQRLFPTKTHGIGRFIFGGIVELSLQQALRELGFQVTDVSHLDRIDLRIGLDGQEPVEFSVKGTASLTSGIILKNFHGNKTESTEPLAPTIIVRMNYETRTVNILFLTQSIVDSIVYTGKRSKTPEKIKMNDATVTLQNGFLHHLINVLDSELSLTLPLPSNIPNCVPIKANELILRYVDHLVRRMKCV